MSRTPSIAARARSCKPVDLDLAEALDGRHLEQPLGPRERADDLAADLDRVAVRLGQPVLHDARLAHRDALADDERGGGLVRGVEADRAEPVVLRLERAEDRVALADRLPAGAVVIERQRASGLAPGGLEIVGAGDLAVDGPVGCLPDIDGGAVAPAFDRERHEQPGGRAVGSDPGREPAGEVLGGGQRERPARFERERRHVGRTLATLIPGWCHSRPATDLDASGAVRAVGERGGRQATAPIARPERVDDDGGEGDDGDDAGRWRTGSAAWWWLLVVVSPVSSRAPLPDSGGCPVLDGRMSHAGPRGDRLSTSRVQARGMARVYDRAHADLPRSRGDDPAPPRGPRRDAALPDRVVRQPELGAHLRSGGAGRSRRGPRARRATAQRTGPRDRLHVRRDRGQQPRAQGGGLGRQGTRPPDRHLVGRAPRGRPHPALPREVRVRDRRAAGRPLRPGRPGAARGGAQRQDDPRVGDARQQRGRDAPADRRDRRPGPRSQGRPPPRRRGPGRAVRRPRRRGARRGPGLARARTSSRAPRASASCTSATGRTSSPSSRVAPRSAIAGPAPRTSPGAVGLATAYELSCAERPATVARLAGQRDRLDQPPWSPCPASS